MLKAKAKEAGRRITVGEDKAYDTADHVANLRALNVTPHMTQNDSITATGKRRQSAIDGRTTRHQGYGLSQSCWAMTERHRVGVRSQQHPATAPNPEAKRRKMRQSLGSSANC